MTILSQGPTVADSLTDYLRRHPEMEARLSRSGTDRYLTTEAADRFAPMATLFLGRPVAATRITLA